MLKNCSVFPLLLMLMITFCGFQAKASHIMGGSITYECQGNGNYIFELVFYRDCNGAQVNTNSQTLKVWNHTVLNSITLPYFSTEDISPEGTANSGVQCFDCTTPNGNIGLGSIQKITYRSAPVNLSGVPPAQGWIFTFDDFSRNGNITNLQNPLNYGVTLTAKIYNVGASNNICHDNSPKFLQNPHFVSCVGKPYKLNLNPVDPDLDSLVISFDQPLTNLNNNPYVEGTNPTAIPFVAGFNIQNPTPTTAMAAGNINAQINANSGEITFQSSISGNFNIKLKVESFRGGRKVSEVVHEMQIIVTNCQGTNNPPIITPPFAGTYETTVNAGDLVTFNLSANDPEVLQDGTPQTVSILPTGLLFGPNATVAAGCLNGPCPSVGPVSPAVGPQGATLNFNWQTNCSHLLDVDGNEMDEIPYQFVFRVQDNYCPIPEVKYETVTIRVVNPGVIQAPAITCIQGVGTSDFTLNWTPVADPNGTFVAYEIHTVQNGLIATIPAIGTNSYTHTGVIDDLQYFITVRSGCSGQALRNSDTLRNIYLDLSNIQPGTAILDWSNPILPASAGMGSHYLIKREYPAGIWTVVDSVPYGVTHYEEIIDVCSAFLNYQIELANVPCMFSSQINGALFNDQTPPDIPNMSFVTIDTITNETTISWTQPLAPDTYGYIVYMQDPVTGFLIELDTIFGATQTSYTYLEEYISGPVTYTVAAFDSCPSPFGAPFNLSARDPNFHSTIYLNTTFSVCDGNVNVNWNQYRGWTAQSYTVFVKTTGGIWENVSTTNNLTYAFIGQNLLEYAVVVRANKGDGITSFSNVLTFTVNTTPQPAYSYIQTATVHQDEKSVEVKYIFDAAAPVTKVALQRQIRGGFETIQEINQPTNPVLFIDQDVDVDTESYVYRVLYFDSCGNEGYPSNIGKTVLLDAQINQSYFTSYINWSPYEQFNGTILGYNLFRSVDGTSNYTFISMLSPSTLSYEDTLYNVVNDGKVCYRIEAVEGPNVYNAPQTSLSNEVCVLIEPTLYIPNAFYPDGINTIFIPVLRSYVVDSYRMTILNRWGQVMFQTNNPQEGWNGRLQNTGPEAETATYVYMIEFNDGLGIQHMTRGHVTLLR